MDELIRYAIIALRVGAKIIEAIREGKVDRDKLRDVLGDDLVSEAAEEAARQKARAAFGG